MNGILYVVATPIGNLEDITLRALRILSEVNGIAAEDTRRTRKLLTHFDIHKPLVSLHEHNESQRISYLRDKLAHGENWALVSDAGTPGLSDPGATLVSVLRTNGFSCIPIPGPSALATAISVSGLESGPFYFEGFLPVNKAQRNNRLQTFIHLDVPIFLYEAPHRLKKTLQALFDALGDREITLFRELTKLHEEVLDTTLQWFLDSDLSPRGEYVILIKAKEDIPTAVSDQMIVEHAEALIVNGLTRKQAIVQSALDLHVRKNRVYRLMLDR